MTSRMPGLVARFGARDEVRDHGGYLRRAEIARQDHPAANDRTALLDPEQEIADQLASSTRPRMVG